jgi:parallel beta-helix repeat protein
MKKEWLVKTRALVIFVLFICTGIVSAFNTNSTNNSQPLNLGIWLYVGGNETGNYTSIQDAVDNASDGDTVFVYNGTYYEEDLVINKSISLIGEDKNTTIIDGNRSKWYTIFIDESLFGVTINGFTIVGGLRSGISMIGSGFCIFENNVIHSNYYGIELWGEYCTNNIIRNNNISNNYIGIYIYIGSNYNNISYNLISNNLHAGINTEVPSVCNNISFNHISNNQYGIRFDPFYWGRGKNNVFSILNGLQLRHSYIISNNISFNDVGVYIYGFVINYILKNNFIFNDKDAYFECRPWNIWDGNYWNRTRFLPYPIYGKVELILLNIFLAIYFGESINPIRWIDFDWHPAKEPYVI